MSNSNFLTGTSNADYHSDRSHLSSSGLKMLLREPQEFYRQYIAGKPNKLEGAHLTEGTLVHSLILEPELVASQYEVYQGLRKAGRAYEEFLAKSAPGKTVISAAQMLRAEALLKSFQRTKTALELISGGFPEHSMVSRILDVPVKARADYINVTKRYIVDVKTTSAPTGKDFFKEAIRQFSYDLSASLYCQIAHDTYGQQLFDFYWLVLSKADKGCAVYRASSETLSLGAAQVMQSLVVYKKCLASGVWTLEADKHEPSDEVEVI